MAVKRIQKEIEELTKYKNDAFEAKPDDNNIFLWHGSIQGPEGTPYEGGVFKLKIDFPSDYPYKPPKIVFITKIFHCNINSAGGICLDILYDKWSPVLTLGKILLSLSSLLSECNPEDPLVSPIAHLYKKDREKHDEKAREWTMSYAIE